MGQSLVKNYLHIIFSTKNRQPFIQPDIEHELHSYLGGICHALECTPIKIGGYIEHVHILCMFSKKITLIKFLQELKSQSSLWAKDFGDDYKNFYWQVGYAAYSVNPKEVDTLIAYIENQHEHHKNQSFEKEYRMFLDDYGLSYDDRYLWD